MSKNKYAIETNIIGKEIRISHGEVNISVKLTKSHIELSGKNGNSFVFRSTNQVKTIKRWTEVIGCLQVALKEIKKQRKLHE